MTRCLYGATRRKRPDRAARRKKRDVCRVRCCLCSPIRDSAEMTAPEQVRSPWQAAPQSGPEIEDGTHKFHPAFPSGSPIAEYVVLYKSADID